MGGRGRGLLSDLVHVTEETLRPKGSCHRGLVEQEGLWRHEVHWNEGIVRIR